MPALHTSLVTLVQNGRTELFSVLAHDLRPGPLPFAFSLGASCGYPAAVAGRKRSAQVAAGGSMSQQLMQILGMGLAVLLLVGGVALLQAWRSGGKSDERRAMATRNGWSHAADVDGQKWRITGTLVDTAFVAEAQRPRHDSPVGEIRPNRTRIVAQVAGPRIRIAPAGLPTMPGAGDLVSLVAGEAAKRLGSAPLVAAEGRFGERYEVRADDAAAARRLLDERLQAALLDAAERWPGSPPIVTWLDGVLTITLGQDLDAAADVEALLHVARAVVESAHSAR